MPAPLTPDSTVGEWLDHPVGGPALRRLLEESGQSPAPLEAVRGFSMAPLSRMGGGRMTAADLDGLVAQVNGAAPPADGQRGGPTTATGASTTEPAGSGSPRRWQERIAPLLATIPEIAEPEHLAASIAFLLSEDSININGALLPSDGGWAVQRGPAGSSAAPSRGTPATWFITLLPGSAAFPGGRRPHPLR